MSLGQCEGNTGLSESLSLKQHFCNGPTCPSDIELVDIRCPNPDFTHPGFVDAYFISSFCTGYMSSEIVRTLKRGSDGPVNYTWTCHFEDSRSTDLRYISYVKTMYWYYVLYRILLIHAPNCRFVNFFAGVFFPPEADATVQTKTGEMDKILKEQLHVYENEKKALEVSAHG